MKVKHFELIQRSFQLAFKNKWLILLAIFLSSLSIYSSNYSSSSNSASRNGSGSYSTSIPSPSIDLSNPSNAINSPAVKSAQQSFESFFQSISNDSLVSLILLVVLIISFIILSIIISIYAKNFALANFNYGIKEVDEDREINLTNLSQLSRTKILNLFLTNLLGNLIYFVIIFFLVVIILITLASKSEVLTGLGILFGSVFGILIVLHFYFSSIYWDYLVLFKNKTSSEAVFLSFKLALKNLIDNFVFRFLQCCVGCVATLGLLLVSAVGFAFLGFSIIGGISLFQSSPLTAIISLPLITIISIAVIILISIGSGIVTLIVGIYGYLFNRDILKEE